MNAPVVVALVVSMAAVVAACTFFDPLPAQELDLEGTSWSMATIDGDVLQGSDVVVSFPSGPVQTHARLQTGCRDTEVEFALDTDSTGLAFASPATSGEDCQGIDADEDALAVTALNGTESWSVLSANEIEFDGTHVIRLTRSPD